MRTNASATLQFRHRAKVHQWRSEHWDQLDGVDVLWKPSLFKNIEAGRWTCPNFIVTVYSRPWSEPGWRVKHWLNEQRCIFTDSQSLKLTVCHKFDFLQGVLALWQCPEAQSHPPPHPWRAQNNLCKSMIRTETSSCLVEENQRISFYQIKESRDIVSTKSKAHNFVRQCWILWNYCAMIL